MVFLWLWTLIGPETGFHVPAPPLWSPRMEWLHLGQEMAGSRLLGIRSLTKGNEFDIEKAFNMFVNQARNGLKLP